jgi:hypothetical protein
MLRKEDVSFPAEGGIELETVDPGVDEPRSIASAASPRPAPPRHDEYRPDPDRWMVLGVCLAAGFMTLLDVSIVNVALPSIEQGLHAQPNELEWIVAGYALSLGLLLVPTRADLRRAGRRDEHSAARRLARARYRASRAARSNRNLLRPVGLGFSRCAGQCVVVLCTSTPAPKFRKIAKPVRTADGCEAARPGTCRRVRRAARRRRR